MSSPWFFGLFSSWQGQLPHTPSTLFLSWSKSLSLLYISLALSWGCFMSHCFILSCAPIFTHKVNVHIDKATAFLRVTPVIRKKSYRHVTFFSWDALMILGNVLCIIPSFVPKRIQSSIFKNKTHAFFGVQESLCCWYLWKEVVILTLVRHPPIFILRKQRIFNLKMFLKLCVSKLVPEKWSVSQFTLGFWEFSRANPF